ncbi:GGDEF domain-containing protein [Paraburkholderia silvatlantica]|uniref:GGDEF domain-containing protein n=1 Tax=Paraburkholderia silvatlantica TaxID=321895 RepID=UPI001AD815A9|nr:GGDEF domain-containing protein [Paraburkholderia silvatlantica]
MYTKVFRRTRISRLLWSGVGAAVLLSGVLPAIILVHLYRGFADARQNAARLGQLRVVLDAANSISAERAPSNILMDSSAATRAKARAAVERARAETDRALHLVSHGKVPLPLVAGVSRQLVVARGLVDAAAARTPPHYVDVQRAIDAMFAAYDAYRAVVNWQAQDLVRADPRLSAPVMRALVLCALRDDAGRLGSQIVAPLITRTMVPPQNINAFHLILGRTEQQLGLLEFEQNAGGQSLALAALQASARTEFTGEGEPLMERLIAEGEAGGPYALDATAFTERYVATLGPLVAWRSAWIDQLVSDYTAEENRALVQFATVFAVALVIIVMIAGIALFIQARVLQPLLEASEAVIGLGEEQPTARARRHRGVREVEALFDAINRLESRLRERSAHTRQLRHLAETDHLTKLLNLRTFEARGKPRIANPDAHARIFLILLDIDHFKSINDRYGHPMGDSVLAAVAGALSNSVRPGDLVARVGGEEFGILCEARDASSIQALAHRVRLVLRGLEIRTPDGECVPVTASFGVAEATGVTWRQLVSRADVALYAAKMAGRDRIHFAAGGPSPNEHSAS